MEETQNIPPKITLKEMKKGIILTHCYNCNKITKHKTLGRTLFAPYRRARQCIKCNRIIQF